MAYAALVSLSQTIDLILNQQWDFISPQETNQIIRVKEYAILLQEFLEDFPGKANGRTGELTQGAQDILEYSSLEHIQKFDVLQAASVEDFPEKANSLEGRIKEAAHAAEDVIEFLFSEKVHESFPELSEFKLTEEEDNDDELYWHRCAGNPELVEHRTWKEYRQLTYDIYDLYKATDVIESIAENMMKIKNSISDKDVGISDSTAAASSSTVAPAHKDVMVGRENDLMDVKFRLCGESSKLQIIPIVGMGGIGKTTFARNVYDDPLIMEYFQIREWVTVSKDYNVEEIISDLLVSMKVFDKEDESMEAHHVYQNLKSRKYLIVLDDLWSSKAWDDLKMLFPDDGNGSRIMITTRLFDVAAYPDPYSHVHEMHLMDEDQSWNLLRQKVFKQDPCPVELEDVGKIIVNSCRGLPLAITVISGLVIVDQTKAAWENIAKDVKSAISANDEQCDKILSLSYTRLPHHLRPCFLYMGGFPEDFKMSASKLIRLWVAEGFLIPNGYNKSFEETADDYLEDLVKRSLVLVTKRKSNGRIKIVGMHDLMREMCIRKAEEENFILHLSTFLGEGIKLPRRLSIFHNRLEFLEYFCGSTIRTIIRENPTKLLGAPCCFGQFRLLRILDLSEARDCFCSFPSLPAEVYELLHLRFLSLDKLFVLGPCISNLQNLQTLIIKDTPSIYSKYIELPEEIWMLPQLRHLIVCYHVLSHPEAKEEGAVIALENLQTLSMARDFVCAPEILSLMPNLKKLGISYIRYDDTYGEDCSLHNLIYLEKLEKLKLEMHEFAFELKHNLAFPQTLKKLSLSGLGLAWKDMAIVGSLPNLEVLKLRYDACVGDTWETTEGEFSQLKFLLIHDSELQYWITESSHFPRLNCLVLRHCYCLTEIPNGIGDIDSLELIKVLGSKSLEDSAKQIHEDQLINCGYSALQVHIEHDMSF